MKGEPPEHSKFKKGESGNPNGITAGEAILKALRAKATKGDVRAAEVLLDRAYGKPKQTTDTNITSTEPLVILLTEPKVE